MKKSILLAVIVIACCCVSCNQKSSTSVTNAVDLGLPSGTLWADMNLGATSCTDAGDIFYWGETTPREVRARYKYVNDIFYTGGGETKYLKYVVDEELGEVDGKYELDPEDDAATVLLGESWSTPTIEDYQELLKYCTWQYIVLNEVKCVEFTGPNGNTILFPQHGWYFCYIEKWSEGESKYWTNTLCYKDAIADSRLSYTFETASFGQPDINFDYRTSANFIRPVKK